MSKPQDRGRTLSAAIHNAFGQLGWHARSRDVVALLARLGVNVGQGMVERIRFGRLKDLGRSALRSTELAKLHLKRRPTLVRKVPQQRTYQR
jgi:hypothetical protein